MRRDAFLHNDSGGLSILAGHALDAMIEDGRADDQQFVDADQAILLELYGDDAMPVRIVVDEPLTPDEQAQWLARVSRPIDARDGRLLVMGGFDPDIARWWQDETGAASDGKGVLLVEVPAGRVRVDLYAHVGSMNGRQVLETAFPKAGAALRRQYPGRPFPLWLAEVLDYSGEEDPGHEALWRDVAASVESGALAIDTAGGAAIGFLVHVTRDGGEYDEAPEGGWFALDTNARPPSAFPFGLATTVTDPGVEAFLDRALRREYVEPPRPDATAFADLVASWPGEPLAPLTDDGTVGVPLAKAFALYWLTALTVDNPPHFALRIQQAGAWAPPGPSPDFAAHALGDGASALGNAPNQAGWGLWWTAEAALGALAGLPDGAVLDLAIVPQPDDAETGFDDADDVDEDDEDEDEDEDEDDERTDPAIGRARFRGTVEGGMWQIAEASPEVSAEDLAAAVAFVRQLVEAGSLTVRPAERKAFDEAVEMYASEEDALRWNGTTVSLAQPERRTLILLAGPVFRQRFAEAWPMQPAEDEDW
jgi:hypothetical protein